MTLRDLFWFGKVELALDRLDRQRGHPAHPNARDAITDLMRYVRTDQGGIRCAELCAQGFHVGSGLVEKAADLTSNRHCELRGMTWYRDSADAVFNLRALYASATRSAERIPGTNPGLCHAIPVARQGHLTRHQAA